MAQQTFFVNPSRKRKLVAFGFKNPRRRKSRRKNPPTRVHFPSHDETLFRVGSTGRWGRKKKRKAAFVAKRKRRTTPALGRKSHQG